MFDLKKRTTLKALTAGAAAAVIPPSLLAASKTAFPFIDSAKAGTPSGLADVQISLISGHGRWHSVKLTNTSQKTVTLKHVYPGIVAHDETNYDINTLFSNGPLILKPGASHVGVVALRDPNAKELSIPVDVTQKNPVAVKTEYLHFGAPQPVVTTRSSYA